MNKLEIAPNTETSPKVLKKLAGGSHWKVREEVARNPNRLIF